MLSREALNALTSCACTGDTEATKKIFDLYERISSAHSRVLLHLVTTKREDAPRQVEIAPRTEQIAKVPATTTKQMSARFREYFKKPDNMSAFVYMDSDASTTHKGIVTVFQKFVSLEKSDNDREVAKGLEKTVRSTARTEMRRYLRKFHGIVVPVLLREFYRSPVEAVNAAMTATFEEAKKDNSLTELQGISEEVHTQGFFLWAKTILEEKCDAFTDRKALALTLSLAIIHHSVRNSVAKLSNLFAAYPVLIVNAYTIDEIGHSKDAPALAREVLRVMDDHERQQVTQALVAASPSHTMVMEASLDSDNDNNKEEEEEEEEEEYTSPAKRARHSDVACFLGDNEDNDDY